MTQRFGLRRRLLGYLGSSEPSEVPEVDELDPARPWAVLSLVNDWVRHAETKAAATLAATGVTATLLFNVVKDRASPPVFLATLETLGAFFLVAAGLMAVIALWPRLRAREKPTSLLYFDHVARGNANAEEYGSRLRRLMDSPDDELQEVANQVYANAKVARGKYRWAGWALVSLVLAIAFLGAIATLIALESIGATHG